MDVNIGSKYYRYEDDRLVIYRVIDILHNDSNKGKENVIIYKKYVPGKEAMRDLLSKSLFDQLDVIELIPDAKMNIMITAYENGDNDVYAWVYRTDFIATGQSDPILMLKQDGYSNTKNAFSTDNELIYVGDCVSYKTNPTNAKLLDYADFKDVISNYTLSLYITDTLDDILDCVNDAYKEIIKMALDNIKKRYEDNPLIKGISDDLKSLLVDNRFMEEFRFAFNINTIGWQIVLGKESYNEKGDIILNEKQMQRLQDDLQKYIADVSVLAYDRDFDIKSIVGYEHIIVCDTTDTIYLIAFRTLSLYPIDDDIMAAMGVNASGQYLGG